MPNRHDDNAFPWASLPADIALLILEEISRRKHRGWALCATVCKAWQVIIERKNFYQLTLQASCLDEFEYFVIRQRPLMHHICLNIKLRRYACPTCQRDAMPKHSSNFGKAVTRLFSILNTWQPTGRLILELNASSPSDSEHWFKNYCFGPGHEDPGDWSQQEKAIKWHDPKHGWVNGQQVKAPDAPTILRLFSPLCLTPPKHLLEVYAVTGFVIRRELRHEIFLEVLKALWEKLPRLESIAYELWRVRRYQCQTTCTYELASLIRDALPKHVKRISIFKDFNNQLILALNNAISHSGPSMDASSAADLQLAKAFAKRSHNFERLSISYMIDAQQFFTSCQQLPYAWNLLQSLTLTSSTLAQTTPRRDVYTLLQNASLAALNMPQLKSMVLWNSEQGQACAVIYLRHTASGMATLTWRGTWDLDLSYDVVESWKKVASGSCYLRVENEALQDVDIRCHGDAVYHLRLPDGVIDQASLLQIRQEGMMQRMA
ncbi:hypothetical protein O1611_g4855 [Lasiodiplodia mahajangana]|uniref:Uncharacterized protein n=1 Tax=Lasiodiplodia mahajangana TaxID=1108764 RepID=A0ACC2JMT4_9PEZI|nr:hypothetical protein O1611_g4855 [Lasiodiplodia mahajangana]